MVFKQLAGLFFAGALAFSAAAADISIRIAPPRARVERRTASPGRNYVWIPGYQRWDGHGYDWSPGRWEQRPRANARWQAHKWKHQRDGWIFVEGHWR